VNELHQGRDLVHGGETRGAIFYQKQAEHDHAQAEHGAVALHQSLGVVEGEPECGDTQQ